MKYEYVVYRMARLLGPCVTVTFEVISATKIPLANI